MTQTLEARAIALVNLKRQGRESKPVVAAKSEVDTSASGSPWSALLRGMPSDARYTTLNDKKQPVNPTNGLLKKDWNQTGFSVDQLDQNHSHHVKAVGLMLGELSGGIAAIDFDGPGSEETFRHHLGHDVDELPITTTWSSGLPGRYQAAYRVPKDWWGRL